MPSRRIFLHATDDDNYTYELKITVAENLCNEIEGNQNDTNTRTNRINNWSARNYLEELLHSVRVR